MRDLEPDQLIGLAGLLVTLMLFFSLDAKFRFSRRKRLSLQVFHVTSIVGGLLTVVALIVVWIELFLPEDDSTIHVLMYFIPASGALLAALVLAFEVLVLRNRSHGAEDDTPETVTGITTPQHRDLGADTERIQP